MASDTTFDHWKVVFSWGKVRKGDRTQKPFMGQFRSFGIFIFLWTKINKIQWWIHFLLMHVLHPYAKCAKWFLGSWYASHVPPLPKRADREGGSTLSNLTLCAKLTFCIGGGELKGTRTERRKWSRVKNAFLLHLGEELHGNVDSIVFNFMLSS